MRQREEPYLNGYEDQEGCLVKAICTPGNACYATPLNLASPSQSHLVRGRWKRAVAANRHPVPGGDLHASSPVPNSASFVALGTEHTPGTVSTQLCDRGRGAPFPGRHLQVWAQKRTHVTLGNFWFLQRQSSSVMLCNSYYVNLDGDPMPEPPPLVVSLKASQHESQDLDPQH